MGTVHTIRQIPKHLLPLSQWICDGCGQLIERVEDGYLEWLRDEDGQAHGFRIIHNGPASPKKYRDGSATCSAYRKTPGLSDYNLLNFVGENKLAYSLAFLDDGYRGRGGPSVRDLHEFTEILRRCQLPYYEEARIYWRRAEGHGFFGGANEIWPYTQQALQDLLERYRDMEDEE